MRAHTEKRTVAGPAGSIEVALDSPDGAARATAVIAHPHPVYGGTMDNKVVQTIARAAVAEGLKAVRFNFRGVGASAGEYDEGRGEIDDMLAVINACAAEGPLVLAGFSFGAFVTSHVIERLHTHRAIGQVVLVGPATSRFDVADIPEELHERTLIIHGERDDVVELSSTMDWARSQSLPVLVVPDVGHFFHGQLNLLKAVVARHLRA
ncbi:alpha/beta family hydrolase [Hydrogenophaga sp. 5NK40-0174]|uniref:alpha/beta hydrolase n=1 Tax=Hydrogenophaga sp. 5NK40-0174 TaxID=3127649 RepID=UPI00310546B6